MWCRRRGYAHISLTVVLSLFVLHRSLWHHTALLHDSIFIFLISHHVISCCRCCKHHEQRKHPFSLLNIWKKSYYQQIFRSDFLHFTVCLPVKMSSIGCVINMITLMADYQVNGLEWVMTNNSTTHTQTGKQTDATLHSDWQCVYCEQTKQQLSTTAIKQQWNLKTKRERSEHQERHSDKNDWVERSWKHKFSSWRRPRCKLIKDSRCISDTPVTVSEEHYCNKIL